MIRGDRLVGVEPDFRDRLASRGAMKATMKIHQGGLHALREDSRFQFGLRLVNRSEPEILNPGKIEIPALFQRTVVTSAVVSASKASEMSR